MHHFHWFYSDWWCYKDRRHLIEPRKRICLLANCTNTATTWLCHIPRWLISELSWWCRWDDECGWQGSGSILIVDSLLRLSCRQHKIHRIDLQSQWIFRYTINWAAEHIKGPPHCWRSTPDLLMTPLALLLNLIVSLSVLLWRIAMPRNAKLLQ